MKKKYRNVLFLQANYTSIFKYCNEYKSINKQTINLLTSLNDNHVKSSI